MPGPTLSEQGVSHVAPVRQGKGVCSATGGNQWHRKEPMEQPVTPEVSAEEPRTTLKARAPDRDEQECQGLGEEFGFTEEEMRRLWSEYAEGPVRSGETFLTFRAWLHQTPLWNPQRSWTKDLWTIVNRPLLKSALKASVAKPALGALGVCAPIKRGVHFKVEVVAGCWRGGKWPLLHAAAEGQRAGERAAKARECAAKAREHAAKAAGCPGLIVLGKEGAKGKETAGDKEVAAFTQNDLLPLVTIAAVIDLPSSKQLRVRAHKERKALWKAGSAARQDVRDASRELVREEAEGHAVWEAAQGPRVPTCVAEMEVLVENVSVVQVAAIVLRELVLAPTVAARRAPIDVVVVELGVARSFSTDSGSQVTLVSRQAALVDGLVLLPLVAGELRSVELADGGTTMDISSAVHLTLVVPGRETGGRV
jgi:hypothetical protein